jgi:GNAT superfamily N-acetyltransferase
MSLVPFTHAHVLPAATLVAADAARLRLHVPALPVAWEDPGTVVGALSSLAERGAGLAAIDDGELIGFQVAMTIDGRGGRWTYTPDVGHVAPPDPEGRLRTELYAELAEGWIRAACPEHVISIPADDDVALATYARLGFGDHVVDLVADLRPISTGALPEGVFVRRAVARDASGIVDLEGGLRRHLEASPVFLRLGTATPLEVHRRKLEDETAATFVAERDGQLVAYLRIGPCATDVAMLVRDAGTASVTGAFTRPELRRADVATHLLAEAVEWAHVNGYARWAVDHESANAEAGRFWARHATPFVRSLSRRLPPNTLP